MFFSASMSPWSAVNTTIVFSRSPSRSNVTNSSPTRRSIHVTNARWLTPSRQEIDGVGLTPDIRVQLSEEDRSQGRDPQLERAIEHLKQQG